MPDYCLGVQAAMLMTYPPCKASAGEPVSKADVDCLPQSFSFVPFSNPAYKDIPLLSKCFSKDGQTFIATSTTPVRKVNLEKRILTSKYGFTWPY